MEAVIVKTIVPGKNWKKNHRPAAVKARKNYYEKHQERIKQRFRDRYQKLKQENTPLTSLPAEPIKCTCICNCGFIQN